MPPPHQKNVPDYGVIWGFEGLFKRQCWLPSLKLTACPSKKASPKRKGSSCNHQFSGAKIWVSGRNTLQEINISPKNGILKMIFLVPRWDMLIPWRVTLSTLFEPSLGRPRSFENQSIWFSHKVQEPCSISFELLIALVFVSSLMDVGKVFQQKKHVHVRLKYLDSNSTTVPKPEFFGHCEGICYHLGWPTGRERSRINLPRNLFYYLRWWKNQVID